MSEKDDPAKWKLMVQLLKRTSRGATSGPMQRKYFSSKRAAMSAYKQDYSNKEVFSATLLAPEKDGQRERTPLKSPTDR